jgi:uroporphyrinogen decarboxylase
MLTSKERIARILRHEPVDRVGLFEVYWRETAENWAGQGHFAEPEMVSDHFGLDVRRSGGEITPAAWRVLNLMGAPDAANEIVEETDSARLVRDGNGALLRWPKGHSGGPEHVDFLVKDRRSWDEHIRPRLLEADSRLRRVELSRYRDYLADCRRKHLFSTAGVVGAFDLMSPLCGHEHLLAGMAADPDWIRDMAGTYAEVTIELLEILFEREGLPDGLWVWDDLGFKHRPFMSPAMYRELIFPAHRRLFEFAHGRGLPVVLHCDGFIEPLLPQLIEAGIDCLQPLEVKAGMDLLKLKKAFGDRIALIGGMDARALVSNDLAQVAKELEDKLPAAMAGSGYVLQVDHSVPDQVNFETYEYFVEKGLEIGKY